MDSEIADNVPITLASLVCYAIFGLSVAVLIVLFCLDPCKSKKEVKLNPYKKDGNTVDLVAKLGIGDTQQFGSTKNTISSKNVPRAEEIIHIDEYILPRPTKKSVNSIKPNEKLLKNLLLRRTRAAQARRQREFEGLNNPHRKHKKQHAYSFAER